MKYLEDIDAIGGMLRAIESGTAPNSKERFRGSIFVVDENNVLSLGKTVIPLDVAPKSTLALALIFRFQTNDPLP
jgi:hypothetical protein